MVTAGEGKPVYVFSNRDPTRLVTRLISIFQAVRSDRVLSEAGGTKNGTWWVESAFQYRVTENYAADRFQNFAQPCSPRGLSGITHVTVEFTTVELEIYLPRLECTSVFFPNRPSLISRLHLVAIHPLLCSICSMVGLLCEVSAESAADC